MTSERVGSERDRERLRTSENQAIIDQACLLRRLGTSLVLFYVFMDLEGKTWLISSYIALTMVSNPCCLHFRIRAVLLKPSPET